MVSLHYFPPLRAEIPAINISISLHFITKKKPWREPWRFYGGI